MTGPGSGVGDPVLAVSDLSKRFGGVVAVEGCWFEVPRAKVTGLIGPNGAGKSTTIDLVSGFLRPDGGRVTFEGRSIEGLAPHQVSRMGLVRTFQTPREWPAFTVLENLLLADWQRKDETIWGALRGPGKAGRKAAHGTLVRAREVLADFGIEQLKNERAVTLSGGQKRLLEFARIEMVQPKMIVLDEPMGGVNPVLGERMASAITGFVSGGASVMVVEHNLPFIERVTDHVVVMAEGTVIASGPFASLRSNPAVIDAYLGGVALDESREATP